MNHKHLALNYNINAILDKSESERKTFLDKMLEEKKETARLLKKLKPFAQQESLNKLSKQLQVLNTTIEQVKKSIPLVDHRKVLEQLGDVFPVTHQVEGKTVKSLSLLVTEAGVTSCGFDLAEIFKHCPKNKTWQTTSTGHIVDIDLYQQLALAEAFVLKYPELKTNFGFYNLLGSKDVYSVLKDKVATNIIPWFYTGEVFDNNEYIALGGSANKYEKSKQRATAGIVTLSTVKKGTDSKVPFCSRSIIHGRWNYIFPDHLNVREPLVLGLII